MKTDIFKNRTTVVAEIGMGHKGDLGELFAMIRSAAKAGADAVKLQIRVPDVESDEDEQFREGAEAPGYPSRFAYWQGMNFTGFDFSCAIEVAHECGLIVGGSVFSPEGVRKAVRAGVDYLKIGSAHVIDTEIVSECARMDLPVVVSGGIHPKRAKKLLRAGLASIFLHCVSIYPTPARLQVYPDKELYPNEGFSDHSGTIWPSLNEAARMAGMVEVHVVYSRDQGGIDSLSSITFLELSVLCEGVRYFEQMERNTKNGFVHKVITGRTEKLRKSIETGRRFRKLKEEGKI